MSGRLADRLRMWGWKGFFTMGGVCTAALILLFLTEKRQVATIDLELEKYTRMETLVLARLLIYDLSSDPEVIAAHRIELALAQLGPALGKPGWATQPENADMGLLRQITRDRLDWPDTELWKIAHDQGLNPSLAEIGAARRSLFEELLEERLTNIREDLTARVTFSDNLSGVRLITSRGVSVAVGEPIGEAEVSNQSMGVRRVGEKRLLVSLPLTVQAGRWGTAYLLIDRQLSSNLNQQIAGALRAGLWALVGLLMLLGTAWGVWWGMLLSRARTEFVEPIVALAMRMEGDKTKNPEDSHGVSEPERLSRAFAGMQIRQAAHEEELLAGYRQMSRLLAHEIRNPLTPMRLWLQELAALDPVDPAYPRLSREAQAILLQQVDRMTDLVERFRALSQDRPVDLVSVRVAKVTREISEALAPLAGKCGVALKWEVPEEMRVVGEEGALYQVLFNLIRNAVEASAGRGKEVAISARIADGVAILEVLDQGGGLPPEVVEAPFTPYITTKPGGTGLGLLVCLEMVRRMGGDLVLENRPGEGLLARAVLKPAD